MQRVSSEPTPNSVCNPVNSTAVILNNSWFIPAQDWTQNSVYSYNNCKNHNSIDKRLMNIFYRQNMVCLLYRRCGAHFNVIIFCIITASAKS